MVLIVVDAIVEGIEVVVSEAVEILVMEDNPVAADFEVISEVLEAVPMDDELSAVVFTVEVEDVEATGEDVSLLAVVNEEDSTAAVEAPSTEDVEVAVASAIVDDRVPAAF